MAETLGSLCDKLTIVKLKQFHTEDPVKLTSLNVQEQLLTEEIDDYLADALLGNIPRSRLSFPANKVYKEQKNEVKEITGNLGQVFGELAKVNCDLWHEQEKVYDFERIPVAQKDAVVKNLAILNLVRNKCIDQINNILLEACHRLKS